MKFDVNKFQACDQKTYMMDITDKGHLCKVCKKQLVDFRNMNLKQIEEIHAKSNEQICGTYDKSLFIIHRKANLSFFTKVANTFHKSILASSTFVFFISNSFARADEQLKDSSIKEFVKIDREDLSNKIRIFGTITEKGSYTTVSNAKIYIPFWDLTAYSNIQGEYEFLIEKSKIKDLDNVQLSVTKDAFLDQIINLLKIQSNNHFKVDIKIESLNKEIKSNTIQKDEVKNSNQNNNYTNNSNESYDEELSGLMPTPRKPWYKSYYEKVARFINKMFGKDN